MVSSFPFLEAQISVMIFSVPGFGSAFFIRVSDLQRLAFQP